MIPDLGCYQPERVADAFIGVESIDIMEDIVLLCDKKSEVSIRLVLCLYVSNIVCMKRRPSFSVIL